MTDVRRTLPLLGAHAGRSARTCALKCGSACFHAVPNTSSNEYIGDVVTASLSRRTLMKGAFGALVLAGVPGLVRPQEAWAAPAASSSGTGLSFTPIEPTSAEVDEVRVPQGYAHDVLISWGDPVVAGAPAFSYGAQTAEKQAQQFGYNCDYVGFLPTGPGSGVSRSSRGLLTVNHEYTEPDRMFPGYAERATLRPDGTLLRNNPTKDEVDVELAAHGLSVLEVARSSNKGAYDVVAGSRKNRRITATTPMAFTGPAAGSELLRTSQDRTGRTVLGTLNNCAGGMTPWGTVLSGEENFNQYFANRGAMPNGTTKTAAARYGLPSGGSERRWEEFYDRFDLAKEPNEAHRFGWVVEVDPDDPTSTPRKHTALGRFKHEAATVSIAPDGRAVAYSGDDERFDYVYKFVSRKKYVEGDKKHNMTLLEDGDLYVARFTGDSPQSEIETYNTAPHPLPADGEFDGSGSWIPLVLDGRSQVPDFSVEQVLVWTRLAADRVGATKMDRPEDVERNPVNGRVYLAMTNNTDRRASSTNGRTERNADGTAKVDEANPRRVDERGVQTGNKYGHVIELEEAGGDQTALTFAWRIFLVAGNPTDPTTYFAGFPKDRVSPISCPDNVAFDPAGNLWLATDGAPGTIGKSDAFHAVAVSGPERGRTRQFLSVPAGAEACGPEFTPDGRTVFCAVQHPGEGRKSDWPDRRADLPARPSVISVFHTQGDKRIGA